MKIPTMMPESSVTSPRKPGKWKIYLRVTLLDYEGEEEWMSEAGNEDPLPTEHVLDQTASVMARLMVNCLTKEDRPFSVAFRGQDVQ